MNTKSVISAGLVGFGTTAAFGAVRLNNPNPSPSFSSAVTFDWDILDANGQVVSSNEDGYIECGPGTSYVDVEDEECGCPEGVTATPCYMRANAVSAEWSYL